MPTLLAKFQDWALEKGMAGEIKKAGLTAERVALSFGELAFLRTTEKAAPYGEAVLMLHGAAATPRPGSALRVPWALACHN